MLASKVKDIMLSLSEYAVVDQEATLAQAIAVLHRAQAQRPQDRQPHRAVLVRDADGAIIGKLGHLAFLKALLPGRCDRTDQGFFDRAGVSDDLRDASAGVLELFGDDVVDVCARAKSVLVLDACTPATASIAQDAHLLEAVRAFLVHQTLSLLVSDGRRTVGILRLADLFDALAEQVRDDACSDAPTAESQQK